MKFAIVLRSISGDVGRESAFSLLADSHSLGLDEHTQKEAAGSTEFREELEYNWLWTQTVLGTNSGLPLACYVTFGRSLDLSGLWFPSLSNGYHQGNSQNSVRGKWAIAQCLEQCKG